MSEHDLSACGNLLSQTTGVADSAINAVMAFINSQKELCKKREDKLKETSIDDFNLFTFLAKKDNEWRMEKFHSRVLQSILDPKTALIGNKKYLRLFMDVLCENNTNTMRRQFSDDVVVKTEETDKTRNERGQIDIFIHDNTCGIIIENKLNNAGDQDDQLPRYMNIAKNQNIEVLAVVYIPTTYHEPSFIYTEQYTGLLSEIKQRLVVLPANELAEKFLDKCVEVSKDNDLARVYISEYSKLVKHIGGINMTAEIDMELLEKIFSSKENLIAAKNIADVWEKRKDLIREAVGKVLKQQFKWQDLAGGTVATLVGVGIYLYWQNDFVLGFCNPAKEEHWLQTSKKKLQTLLEQKQPEFRELDCDDIGEEADWGFWVQTYLPETFFDNWSGGNLTDFIVEKCRSLEKAAKELLSQG